MDLSLKLQTLENPLSIDRVDWAELTSEDGYLIKSAKFVKTSVGTGIAVEIHTKDDEIKLGFLPRRYVDNLTEKDVAALGNGSWKVKCTGKSGRTHLLVFFM